MIQQNIKKSYAIGKNEILDTFLQINNSQYYSTKI
jgi:hypothetical protein